MRSSIILTGALSALSGLASAQSGAGYVCPITPPQDATALEFAYAAQRFLYNFYEANGNYTASMFASFPNSTMVGNNGMPLSADLATNFAGLKKQSMLGVQGITELSSMAGSGYRQPMCNYKYPPGFQSGASASEFVMSAYFIEATLCGTFIGLADYVQTPPAAFLMARLAAEHGIHASYIGSYMKETPYSADSMALTPAFTPQQVLQMGSGATMMDVGKLGQYIPASCAPIPPAPCGGNVQIGMINAMYSMGGANGSMNGQAGAAGVYGPSSRPAASSTYAAGGAAGSTSRPASSSSASPVAYTGEANSKMARSMALVGGAAIAVAAAMI